MRTIAAWYLCLLLRASEGELFCFSVSHNASTNRCSLMTNWAPLGWLDTDPSQSYQVCPVSSYTSGAQGPERTSSKEEWGHES